MPSSATGPNILLIHGDQHRWDCLGAYGNPQVKTPHLDEIARGGVRFENSFCPFPVCTPSRYSLLSGLYVRQHAGWTNHCTLAPGIATFPRLLRAAGYKTKAVGKMHFTPTYLDVGFDEMELAEQDGDGRMDDDYHRELRAHDLIDADDLIDQRSEFRRRAPKSYWQTFGAQTSNLPEKWHSTTWIGDHAVETLEGWTASGNLLMVGFVKPHHPFDPPAPWDQMYDPDKMTVLPGWVDALPEQDAALHRGYFPNASLTEAALQRITAFYYATISHLDHQVGRMIEVLKRRGLYDKTLIVYTSDHGEYLGYHHLLLKGGYMYEPLVRVPLMIKFTGVRDGGSSRSNLVNNLDLAPTLLHQAGVKPAPDMKGLDLSDASVDRPFVFTEGGRGGGCMVRSRRYKLLLAPSRARTFFYDLESDPHELANRIDDPVCRVEVDRHRRALEEWATFEAIRPVYIDERAPCIGQPAAPLRVEDGRRQMHAYFEKKVSQYLSSHGEK